MRAPISIVIPTLNAESALPACVEALSQGLTKGLIRDLVISDGGSGDATLEIADAVGARIVSGPASRGGQLRRGAEAARGDWLLFLHADTVLGPGWAAAAASVLGARGAYYFRLKFDAPGFAPGFVAGWAHLRSRALGLPYGDQGLLVDRASYAQAGGYPDIPLMEDVALARALPVLRPLDAVARTSAEKYRRQGWLQRGGSNLLTLTRYFAGTDPKVLAEAYRR